MVWYGEYGHLGKQVVNWEQFFKARVRRAGYFIIDEDGNDLIKHGDAAGNAKRIKAHIPNKFSKLTSSKQLHGFVFYGHGGPDWVSVKHATRKDAATDRYYRVLYDELENALQYKLAHVEARTCYSPRAESLFSGEPNGYLYTTPTVLCQHEPIWDDWDDTDYFDGPPWWDSATSEEWWDVFYGR